MSHLKPLAANIVSISCFRPTLLPSSRTRKWVIQ